MSDILKTLIVGSGPSGLTAAIYAARASLKPIVLAGASPGGQLTKTSEVENYPGFAKGILGPKLMEDMIAQAQHCGAEFAWESVTKIVKPAKHGEPFTVVDSTGKEHRTLTVIFATGAAPRFLGVKGELDYQPKQSPDAKVGGGNGVTYCAVCDGNFYRKMPVIVVGGGDTAMEEANYLAKLCSTVTVVHRREEFKASKVMLERARKTANIKWELNAVVDEVYGEVKGKLPTVTGAKLKSTKDGSIKDLKIDGVFVAIGHIPTTSVLKGVVDLDEDGYIKTNDRQETSVEGLFAAGDCHDKRYRQAITAAGMGCKAALEVEKYLTHHNLA